MTRSGADTLSVADNWKPEIILLDLTIPITNGPTTLARLCDNPRTSCILVAFTTTHDEIVALERFRSDGAVSANAKPFDPITLAASRRSYARLRAAVIDDLRVEILHRIRTDIVMLSQRRLAMRNRLHRARALDLIKRISHGISGAGGIDGFAEICDTASVLEKAANAELRRRGIGGVVDVALGNLILQVNALQIARRRGPSSNRDRRYWSKQESCLSFGFTILSFDKTEKSGCALA